MTDLIVDLRYNGGGTLNTAALLANLIRSDRAGRQVMARLRFNHHQPELPHHFQAEPEALSLRRVAFIVTGRSASSSELLVNVLTPYFLRQDLALVGSRTHGKPVGMIQRPIPGTDLESYLVEFQALNAAGAGGYFQSLPDAAFAGSSRAAEDDLRHAPGDRAEASTAAALDWIVTGAAGQGLIRGRTAQAPESGHGPGLERTVPDPGPGLAGRDPDLPGLI